MLISMIALRGLTILAELMLLRKFCLPLLRCDRCSLHLPACGVCQDDRPQRSTGNSNSKVKRSLGSESVDVSSCVENVSPFVAAICVASYAQCTSSRARMCPPNSMQQI